eukprot:scaffold20264_cov65-Phaeocystis_antarctica.AAC.3
MASVRQVRAGRTPSLSGHVWAHDSDLILPPQSETGYQEEIPTVQQSLAPEEKAIEVPKGEVKPAEVQPLFASARPLPPAYCRPYRRQATIPFFTAPVAGLLGYLTHLVMTSDEHPGSNSSLRVHALGADNQLAFT